MTACVPHINKEWSPPDCGKRGGDCIPKEECEVYSSRILSSEKCDNPELVCCLSLIEKK